jgi:hypothetical protein
MWVVDTDDQVGDQADKNCGPVTVVDVEETIADEDHLREFYI